MLIDEPGKKLYEGLVLFPGNCRFCSVRHVRLNARSEIDSTVQAEYWLEHVQSFSKDAPVMIVGNKADQSAINLDMNYLKGQDPTIVNFYSLSCTRDKASYKAEFERFQWNFCRQLQQVGPHQMLFSQEQSAVLEDLHECSLIYAVSQALTWKSKPGKFFLYFGKLELEDEQKSAFGYRA